jgi:hypothetical protein
MQILNRVIRIWGAVCVIGGALVSGRAQASPITDSFSFDNPAYGAETVTGTFTYDTSNPSVVTDLTMDWGTLDYDTADSVDPPTLPTFDGSELNGAFSMDQDFFPVYEDFLSGTFGPGPNASITDTYTFEGFYPIGGDSVSGPITYDLTGSSGGGGGSPAPLPAGALGGALAVLAAAGCALQRKRASVV